MGCVSIQFRLWSSRSVPCCTSVPLAVQKDIECCLRSFYLLVQRCNVRCVVRVLSVNSRKMPYKHQFDHESQASFRIYFYGWSPRSRCRFGTLRSPADSDIECQGRDEVRDASFARVYKNCVKSASSIPSPSCFVTPPSPTICPPHVLPAVPSTCLPADLVPCRLPVYPPSPTARSPSRPTAPPDRPSPRVPTDSTATLTALLTLAHPPTRPTPAGPSVPLTRRCSAVCSLGRNRTRATGE